MSSIVFRGTVVLPATLLPRGVVVVEGERIVAVGPEADVKWPAGAEIIDAHEGYVSPGFVDIHTHGGAGSDYMDGTPEAVRVSNRAHARHGTTTLFPTTTTGTPAQLRAMLDAVDLVRRDWNVNARKPRHGGRPLSMRLPPLTGPDSRSHPPAEIRPQTRPGRWRAKKVQAPARAAGHY